MLILNHKVHFDVIIFKFSSVLQISQGQYSCISQFTNLRVKLPRKETFLKDAYFPYIEVLLYFGKFRDFISRKNEPYLQLKPVYSISLEVS